VSDTPATAPAVQRFLAFRKSLPKPQRLHRTTVSARGLQFAVFSTADPGTGALPLLCVNGGLLFDHRLLWPALSPLATHRQLIFYDQRGRGHSSVPPAPRSSRIEFDAGDLSAIAAALNLRRYHLLGHSYGGGIALLSTNHNTDSIASLTLISPVGLQSDWLDALTARAAQRLSGAALEALLAADAAVKSDASSAAEPSALSDYANAIYPAWFANAELASVLTPPRSTSVTGAAVSARLRRDGYDWRAAVGQVSMPTLLLHGDSDLIPMRVAEDTIGTLGPKATLIKIAGAGHNPFWEAPSIVFPAIETFLATIDSAQSSTL
jgi:proline iminopeptidase